MLKQKLIRGLILAMFIPLALTAQDKQGNITNYNYPWKKHRLMVKLNPDWKVAKVTPEKILASSNDLKLELVPWTQGGSDPKAITQGAIKSMKGIGKGIVLNEQNRGEKRGFSQHLVFTQYKGKDTQYFVLVGLKDTQSSKRILAKFHWKGNKGISAKMKKVYAIVDGFEKLSK